MGSCFVRTFETHPKHDRVSSDSKLCRMRKGSWTGYPSGFATRILCVANMSNTMFFTFCKHAFWISLGPKLSSLKTCKTMNFCTMFQLLRHVQMRQGRLTQRETMKRCLSYQSTPYCRMTLHTCNTLDSFGGETVNRIPIANLTLSRSICFWGCDGNRVTVATATTACSKLMLFVHLPAELNSKKNPKASSHWQSRKTKQEESAKNSKANLVNPL